MEQRSGSWRSACGNIASHKFTRVCVGRIREMTNVDIYLDSELTPVNVLEFGFTRILVATGARWRKDGAGVTNAWPIPGSEHRHVFAPRPSSLNSAPCCRR